MNMPCRIGIIGGGQLGRMLAMAAKQMGHHVTVLDPVPHSPAGQVADRQIVAGFAHAPSLRELVENSDVVTYEFEHVDAGALHALEAEGHVIRPSAATLLWIQDKLVQKTRLRNHGVDVPDFMEVLGKRDLEEGARRFGYPFVLKRRHGGYDGKGFWVIRHEEELEALGALADGTSMLAERYVDYACELSVMVACSSEGDAVMYPVSQNVHEEGILRLSIVPANVGADVEARVRSLCRRVIGTLSDVGVFCVELFLTTDGQVLVNEIAPRPHNSGHYTIEACATSQYEQLVRVMTGCAPGSATLRSACAMSNLLGPADVAGPYRVEGLQTLLCEADVHVHLYGKAFAAHRKKLGHVTVLDANAERAAVRCMAAARDIRFVPDAHAPAHESAGPIHRKETGR